MIGRVVVVLRPGDQIPEDCRIVRAFTDPERYDVSCIVIEASWLPEAFGPSKTWALEMMEMSDVWLMRRKVLFPIETATLEALR